jgi:excisionase family DNA binding protein
VATLSLGQAAKIAGVGKTTLTRAIKGGRLSAERLPDGSYRIDPAELARAYELSLETPATGSATSDVVHRATPARDRDETPVTPNATARLAALEAEIAGLREMLRRADRQADDLRGERDQWRDQAQTAQRMLSDQRGERRSWWKRLAG